MEKTKRQTATTTVVTIIALVAIALFAGICVSIVLP